MQVRSFPSTANTPQFGQTGWTRMAGTTCLLGGIVGGIASADGAAILPWNNTQDALECVATQDTSTPEAKSAVLQDCRDRFGKITEPTLYSIIGTFASGLIAATGLMMAMGFGSAPTEKKQPPTPPQGPNQKA